MYLCLPDSSLQSCSKSESYSSSILYALIRAFPSMKAKQKSFPGQKLSSPVLSFLPLKQYFCKAQTDCEYLHIYVYRQISIILYFEIKIQSKSFGLLPLATGWTGVALTIFIKVTDFGSHNDNIRLLPPVRDSKRKGKNILCSQIE